MGTMVEYHGIFWDIIEYHQKHFLTCSGLCWLWNHWFAGILASLQMLQNIITRCHTLVLNWWFPEMAVPLIIRLNRMFRYKPSSYWGTPIWGTSNSGSLSQQSWHVLPRSWHKNYIHHLPLTISEYLQMIFQWTRHLWLIPMNVWWVCLMILNVYTWFPNIYRWLCSLATFDSHNWSTNPSECPIEKCVE